MVLFFSTCTVKYRYNFFVSLLQMTLMIPPEILVICQAGFWKERPRKGPRGHWQQLETSSVIVRMRTMWWRTLRLAELATGARKIQS